MSRLTISTVSNHQSDLLNTALSDETICVGDIILAEVLQGFRKESDYLNAKQLLTAIPIYQLLSPELALVSADNYRLLRKRGITVRKSVDVWIATFCIEKQIPLLFSDRGFVPFPEHLGLSTPLKFP